MKKNVTITLEEEVARWARVRAAERNTSVSRLVGELLREFMLEEESYDSAMRQYLSREPAPLRQPGSGYPKRDELHDRQDLR